jgi:hypothetical protein
MMALPAAWWAGSGGGVLLGPIQGGWLGERWDIAEGCQYLHRGICGVGIEQRAKRLSCCCAGLVLACAAAAAAAAAASQSNANQFALHYTHQFQMHT